MATETRIPVLNAQNLTGRLSEIKARNGDPPWGEVVAEGDEFRVVAICQAPGHENDYHYHKDAECWYIAEGRDVLALRGSNPSPSEVSAGDFVFAPKYTWHHIEVLGDRPAIRIAVTRVGEMHRYDRPRLQARPSRLVVEIGGALSRASAGR